MANSGAFLDMIRNTGKGLCLRMLLTVLVIAGFLYTVVLTALSTYGSKPFENEKGFYGVTDLETCLMPASYYYFIRIFVGFALFFMTVFAIVMVVQKFVLGQNEKHCGALPLSFMAVLIVSLNLNTGWLFVEDDLNAIGSFVLILLLFISNCIAICYASYNFTCCGSFLYQDAIMDFWMGIIVLNCMAIYAAWSLVQFCLSFTVLLIHEGKYDTDSVCLGVLITLQLLLIIWFIIENSVLASFLNPVVAHYVVLVWYIATLYPSQVSRADSVMRGLLITSLVVEVIGLFLRLVITFKRNTGNKIYGTMTPSTAPTEDNTGP